MTTETTDKTERDQRLRDTVKTKLAEHGIEGVVAEEALGSLVDVRKLVRYRSATSDELVFRGHDLDSGFAEWLESEHGQLYAAHREDSSTTAPTKGKLQPGELGRALVKAFL